MILLFRMYLLGQRFVRFLKIFVQFLSSHSNTKRILSWDIIMYPLFTELFNFLCSTSSTRTYQSPNGPWPPLQHFNQNFWTWKKHLDVTYNTLHQTMMDDILLLQPLSRYLRPTSNSYFCDFYHLGMNFLYTFVKRDSLIISW